ncbi:MAG: AI-2E family transporter [Oscillospiraceae bacterium]|nr:AI-2E family transporter [Oscillospiraceae bacterium]
MKDNKDDKERDEWNRKYAVIAVYAFIVIIAGFVAFWIIRWIFDFFSQKQYNGILKALTPVIYGFIIAYLLSPVLIFFEKKVFFKIKKKARYALSLLTTYIVTAIVITLLFLMVIPQVISSVQQLGGMVTNLFSPYEVSQTSKTTDPSAAAAAPAATAAADITDITDTTGAASDNSDSSDASDANSINTDKKLLKNSVIGVNLTNFANSLQKYIDGIGLDFNIQDTVNNFLIDFAANIMNIGTKFITPMFNSITSILYNTASGILNIILGILLSVYLLISKEKFIAQIKKLLFAVIPGNFSYRLVKIMRKTHEIFGGYITGKILDSLIVGVICFIGMSIFNIRYAMLISVIITVTEIIPFFGPIIGTVTSTFFIAISDIWQAVGFLIFMLVLHQIDGNIIGPKIVGAKVGLSSFYVICAVIIMSGLFGLLGMFIGVPIFAVIYVLIKEYAENKLGKKGYPVRTEYYVRNGNFDEIPGDTIKNDNLKIDAGDTKSIFSILANIVKNISGRFGKSKDESDKSDKRDNDKNNKYK